LERPPPVEPIPLIDIALLRGESLGKGKERDTKAGDMFHERVFDPTKKTGAKIRNAQAGAKGFCALIA
jgi:hypothetical protein